MSSVYLECGCVSRSGVGYERMCKKHEAELDVLQDEIVRLTDAQHNERGAGKDLIVVALTRAADYWRERDADEEE